jgi:hypothetical protein
MMDDGRAYSRMLPKSACVGVLRLGGASSNTRRTMTLGQHSTKNLAVMAFRFLNIRPMFAAFYTPFTRQKQENLLGIWVSAYKINCGRTYHPELAQVVASVFQSSTTRLRPWSIIEVAGQTCSGRA